MNIGQSTIKLFVSRVGSSLLFFGGITIFARQLPAEELGVFFLYLAIVGILTILADLGIRGALEKRLSEGDNTSQLLGSALAFKLVTVAVLVVAVFIAGPYIDAYVGATVAPFLAIGIIATEFAELYVHVVRGELRVGQTAPIQFARRVVWVAVGILLVSRGFGVHGIVVGLICGRLVEGSLAFWRCDTTVDWPSVRALHSLITFSKYQTVIAVGGRFYQWMDVLVIGFFLSNLYVSAYEIAWQVTLLVLLVSKSLELNLFPVISRWDAQAATEQIGDVVTIAFGYTMFVSMPAIVGAAIYAREILTFVFQPAYTVAALVLVILMIEKAFQSTNDIVSAGLRGIDKPHLVARVIIISVTLNLVVSPILVVTIGITGAAIATMTAWIVNLVLQYRYLSQFVDVEIPFQLLGWYTACSIFMGAFLLAFEQSLQVVGIATLMVHVGLGAVVYVGLLSLVPTVRHRIIVPGLQAISL